MRWGITPNSIDFHGVPGGPLLAKARPGGSDEGNTHEGFFTTS